MAFGLTSLGRFFKKTRPASTVPVREMYRKNMRAAYDAAKTTLDNENHWSNADFMGPNASACYDVRRKIWSRARYEAGQANSFAKGMVLTKTNDIVGSGPRLQIITENNRANRILEARISDWMEEVRLAEKIWTGRNAITIDGAVPYRAYLNPNLNTEVKLDVAPVECDRLMARPEMLQRKNYVDGILFDNYDNPVSYDFLKDHPGESNFYSMTNEYLSPVKAEYVMHLFRADRPEQKHGVSEIATALPLFAQLRRYTLATIAAAETAAEVAAVMYSTSPAFTNEDIDDFQAMEAIELEMRSMLTLPKGWAMGQIKAEQPTTTYVEFRNAILNEIGRCMNMPFNVAAADSSGYNFASGRLDHQVYFKSIQLDQVNIVRKLLRPLIRLWLEFAMFEGLIPDGMPPISDWRFQWHWDGTEHVDPQKEANATDTQLKNNTITYATVYAKQGKDWETEFRQKAKEQKLADSIGLKLGEPNGEPTEETDTETEEEKETANV